MRNLLHFFMIALSFISLNTALQAQIRYVDVIPDQSITVVGQFFSYDLNGDATTDITIAFNSPSSNKFTFTRSTGVNPMQTLVLSGSNINKLAAGAVIGPSSGTYTTNNTGFCTACINNLFPWTAPPTTNVFVGLKFTLSGSGTTHYGWVRFDMPTNTSSMLVKDFGWEQTPNTPINAGDMGTVLVSSIDVYGTGGATTISTPGGTLQMLTNTLPANATDTTKNWSVDLPSIGTINASGLLTAVSNGVVRVFATATDGSGVSGYEDITISGQFIPVTSVSIQGQGGATTVVSGSTLQMIANVTPANASNPTVTWGVLNGTGTASINPGSGLLTGGNPGTVRVTALANDGSGASDTTTITVTPLLVSSISVQGQGGATSVLSGNNLQMVATVTPANASDPSVTWSVTNGTGSATINPSTGMLTGGNPGTVTVCATANDGSGVQGCTTITINPILVTTITVQGQGGATSVTSGSTLQMLATVTPANASNPSVTWSVTNGTGTASINPTTGMLTGGNPGTVTVCATANDGSGVQGCVSITINPILITAISVQGQGGATSVQAGSTLQMVATITPVNASNQTVVWSVTNGTGTASINPSTGMLTAGNPGTVTVCATATDGSGVQGCTTITVTAVLVTGITVQGQGGATTVLSGNTLQMLATITPANATNPSVTWSVTNGTGSATINPSTGVLTGGSPGTVTVCATATDGSGVQGCTTITINPVLVTGITVQGQGGATSVLSGNTLQMIATVTPANATNSSVTWSVTNGTGTATINPSTGVLTGINPGTVTVCATATDGSGVQGCTTITINPILVTSITVQGQGGATTVLSGSTLQMLATVLPANASNPSVVWSVTNGTGTASINPSTGVLTGGNPGTVTVCATATDGSGVQGCTTITVNPILVTSITVQGQGGATTVLSGSTLQMLATVLPANASNPSVTWSVTNGSGSATINSSTGVLTGGSPGTVTVCATATDGSGVQGCTVITVNPILVTSITVQGQGGATTVLSGSTLQMLATITPANASNPSVVWSVTNGTGSATINPSTGVLTGGSPGTVTVCATATDGSGVQGCTVITINPILVTSITVQGQGGATTVLSGNTLQMIATVTPANATNSSVVWSVTNGTGSATINASTGVLTGGSPGTVTVCATATDGSGVQGCTTITINPILVTSITVQGQGGATTVLSGSTLQMLATVTPANATNSSVVWSVTNGTGTASINPSTGVLTGGNPGTVTVCATATDGSGVQGCTVITINPILVTSITVQGQGGATTVLSGSTLQMLATVLPANASNPSVTWSVTNGTGSATINATTGVLTGGSPGTVTVCATATDGSGVQGCTVITINPILVTSITVQGQGGATSVISGNTLQMLATVLPANASNPSVTWSVTNGTGSATINASTGLLTGGSPGTVTVCATATDGSGVQGCTVITINPILVTSITVQGQGGASSVISGNTLQMLATVLPANASNPSVTWSVTNGSGSATINASTGVLTGGTPGTVTVCATATDGSGVQGCTVITINPILVSSITVQGQGGATSVQTGNTLQMLATITPANATNQTVTWSVTNGTGSATINPSTGLLTGVSAGTVTVCATATDGSGVQGCTTITVTSAPILVSGITVQGQGGATNVVNGNTLQMIATITPSNASNQTVTWSVTNGTGSATINPVTGLLTGTGDGTVTVCATATDGSGVQGCTVINVIAAFVPVSSISVQGQGGATNVLSGNTLQMLATVLPANATDPSVTWSVTNGTGTATINPTTGVLTGGNPGTVTVCATANDGSGVQGCTSITIDPILVSSITVQGQGGATNVTSGSNLQMLATVLPANASNLTIIWSVTNGTGSATINPTTGMLSGGSPGTVTVCATATDGSGVQGCTAITIDPILVTGITVQGQGGATNVTAGSTLQMVATITPANASNTTVVWSVTNGTGTASINPSTGMLTGGNPGTVTVCATATDGSGVQGCIGITIDPILVSSITVQGQGGATSVQSGNTLQMLATVTPANATNSTVVWSVTNGSGTATINPTTGVLTGGSSGTVSVCAMATDGSGVQGCTIITVNAVLVTGITIQGQGGATNVTSGSTLQMVATVTPANASNPSVTWSVVNGTGSASINPTTGVLTGGTPGTVTVCATANDGSGVQGCTTITIDPVLVTGITVQGQGGLTNVTSGSTLQMVATVTPANATNNTVVWSVTNGTGSATINSSTGVLTGSAPGTVTVCATATDGSGTQGCTVITVDPILVTSITVQGQGGATSVQTGNVLQMLATVLPANATNPSVTWSVINGTGSASINASTGVLTGGTVGTVTVCATATDGSGVQGCTTITITASTILVTGITVQGQGGATNTASGSNLQMVATVTPANASNPTVTWSVTNGTGSATINPSTGMLTGGSPGTVTVCATANDGSGVQGCTTITIDPILVTGITVQGQGGATSVQAGNTLQMVATVTPANASNPTVTWSVTNGTGSASINPSTGVLTGGTPGTVTVCATATDGSGVQGCTTITVTSSSIPVSSITVQGQGGATSVLTGNTLQMVATVLPANATNPNVTWTVTNGTGSATINIITGVLTGGNPGTVTVCATAVDGSGVQGCTVITINPILVSSISVQGQGGATSITTGNTLQMVATVLPGNATNPSVTWSVTNGTGSATINPSTGVLTGVSAGTVTVCATANDGSGVQGCTTITIVSSAVLVTGITVQGQGGATSVTSGNNLQMIATITPANATNPTVSWSVTNGTGSATINATTGVLTGGSSGTVTVCATATDGSGVQGCTVITVDPILVTSITVQGQGGATTVQSGNNLQMLATVLPANATNQTVTWSVSNGTGTAAINAVTGVLLGGNPGTVVVRATANDGSGVFGTATITVSPVLVSAITVQGQGGATSINTPSGSLQMIAIISPSNANNQNVTWSINNPSIATISPTGLLTASADGLVTVTATANDGSGVSGSTVITITNQTILVTNIIVQGQNGIDYINVNSGTLQMIATIIPTSATTQSVTWSVNNPGVATINASGVLLAMTNGVVTVIATATDGSGVQGSKQITISNQGGPGTILVNSIQVLAAGGASSINVPSGTLQMFAIVAPSNASNTNVTWSVSNSTIATINSNGILQAVRNGQVLVIATAQDGSNVSGSKLITINNQLVAVEDIDNQQSTMLIYPNPTDGVITLDLYMREFEEDAQLSIFDMTGREIIHRSLNLNQGANVLQLIEAVNWPSGTYLVRISAGKEQLTKKVVRE